MSQLIDIFPDGVFIHQGGKYVFVNPMGEKIICV